MPIIPAIWEAEIGGLMSKVILGKELVRSYLKEQARLW
jgi:hypothetical protein